jgi:hypothetical protein
MWENWKESIEKTTISLSDYNGQTSTDYKELEIKSLTHLLSRNDIKNIEDMSRFDTIGGAMRTGSFASGSFVINIYALACASRKFIEWAHMSQVSKVSRSINYSL